MTNLQRQFNKHLFSKSDGLMSDGINVLFNNFNYFDISFTQQFITLHPKESKM